MDHVVPWPLALIIINTMLAILGAVGGYYMGYRTASTKLTASYVELGAKAVDCLEEHKRIVVAFEGVKVTLDDMGLVPLNGRERTLADLDKLKGTLERIGVVVGELEARQAKADKARADWGDYDNAEAIEVAKAVTP